MIIEDVNEFDDVGSPSKGGVSDDEYIRKSLEALHARDSANTVLAPRPKKRAPAPAIPTQDLGQLIKGGFDYDDQNSNYHEITNLPSLGRLYPEDTVISARPLKVIEVKKLSSLGDGNADFIINDILRRTIRGINVEDILVGDKLFLIMWLRANSFKDSSYRVDFQCGKCETKSDYHFNVDDLEIQHLSAEYKPNVSLKLSTGHQVKMKFLTIKDETTVERFKEMNKDTFLEMDAEIVTIAAMISEINGEQKSLLGRYEFLTGLDAQNFSMIVSYIEKIGMGLKPYMNVKCTKCGGVSPMAITFQQSFFLPSYKFD